MDRLTIDAKQTGASPEGAEDTLIRLTRNGRGTLTVNKDDVTNVLFE